jgi:hypothetical protein
MEIRTLKDLKEALNFEEAQKHEAFGLVEKYFEALRDAYRNEDFEEDVSVKL